MVQMCPAKSIIVPFKKQMYSSGSIILSYKDDKCISVSIHAPMRGATLLVLLLSILKLCFNPRTHEGCDIAYSAKYRILIYKSSHFANINQTITFKVIKSLEFL